MVGGVAGCTDSLGIDDEVVSSVAAADEGGVVVLLFGVLPLSLQAARESARKSAKASAIIFFIFTAAVLLYMV
ncbi:hypothetical protein J14TS5_66160 [Paenibacillus lautus]|nr:hypothetical protein J14TS5_66160 [Paenibacillus lautus]